MGSYSHTLSACMVHALFTKQLFPSGIPGACLIVWVPDLGYA